MYDEKEIKRQVRELRKLKNKSRIKTDLRRDLNGRIRELKKKQKDLYNMTPEKKELIEKIYKARPEYKKIRMDLRKFTIKELRKHWETKCKNGRVEK